MSSMLRSIRRGPNCSWLVRKHPVCSKISCFAWLAQSARQAIYYVFGNFSGWWRSNHENCNGLQRQQTLASSIYGRWQYWLTSRKLILNGIHFLKPNQLMGNWPASSKSSTKTNLCLSSMKRRRKSWPMLWMLLTNQLKAALQSLTTAKVSSKLSSWVQKLRMASFCLVKAFLEAST